MVLSCLRKKFFICGLSLLKRGGGNPSNTSSADRRSREGRAGAAEADALAKTANASRRIVKTSEFRFCWVKTLSQFHSI
jgi:hypothetical protein